ncbi:MAG: DUF4317 domain-containing protein [Oscillospiraceae bacterium]|nr:DUF4317 domain-containing protein [Oscillospiraceae bacterium]
MTEKEIAEIRRRINIDKCSISDIRGCYVNENKEIIAQFSQFLGTVPKDEAAGLLSIIKKVLSGQQGKNLIDIEFSNQQVIDSDEHNLLMKLRDSELKDDETVAEFYKHVISSLQIEGKYLILLTLDKYDVPSYTKDDIKLEDTDTIFKYLLCAICPVTMTKPALSYAVTEQQFKNIKTDWIISNPEIGFMFPAFDDRQANIYDALYYIKNSSLSYDEFTDEIFNTDIPMPADTQKEVFNAIIEESVSEHCDFEVMQTVHNQISEMVAEHKAFKDEPPLTISKKTISNVLEYCNVPTEKVEKFEKQYDESFGENARISPKNVVDVKKFEMKTADISIKVNPERLDLIKTKIIDGQKYILIKAEDDVAVNGVNISITEE